LLNYAHSYAALRKKATDSFAVFFASCRSELRRMLEGFARDNTLAGALVI